MKDVSVSGSGNNDGDSTRPALITATRLHLGKASSPPSQSDLDEKVEAFARFSAESCRALAAVIAVDATPKIDGYDLVQAVQSACDKAQGLLDETCPAGTEALNENASTRLHVLPVTPWGMFVPALNALTGYAANYVRPLDWILFVSAETSASRSAIDHLLLQMKPDTLVAGAVLSGHHYQHDKSQSVTDFTCIELGGRTCPWNTLAVWNLKKLSLVGFQLLSDGPAILVDQQQQALTSDGKGTKPMNFGGIEEVVAVALLQKLLGEDNAKAKLVACPGIEWDVESFGTDPARREWHEHKMKSKEQRATIQLQLTGLRGIVHHC